jgi:hypothetical protein
LLLRACLHFFCIHSFHCLLFTPLSLLFSWGFCCGNLPKQVETVNSPFRELARSESRNLETRCTEAADRTSHSGYFRFPFFEFVLGRLYAEFVQDLISEYGHPKISNETLKRRCIRQAAEKES